jgi:hypothetical protein
LHAADGLPWLTKIELDDLVAFEKSTGPYAAGGVSFRLTDIINTIASILAIVTAIGAGLSALRGWLSSPTKPDDQDPLDTILNRLDARVAALLDGAGGGQWADGRVLRELGHTLDDSFPFVGQAGWGSGRALHRIHIDTTDDRHPFIDIGAAGFWVPGVGWWAPTLPDGAMGPRRPLEFADQWLWPVPEAATGVIIWVHPATSGTLYAYAVP